MKRRNFIWTAAAGTLALGFTGKFGTTKTHVLSLSFDDGFKKSFYKTAEIHEEYGLKACLNIIASAHLGNNEGPENYHSDPVGNFDDWNRLKERGHEIMPHTWAHNNLTEMPFDQATALIDKCLDYFDDHLKGFNRKKAVYNFAYNASTPELEDYALSKVRAVRTGGWNILGGNLQANRFPDKTGPVRLGCWSYGPENADDWVETEVKNFLASDGGWLILNLHGLDDEGWGPVSSNYLDRLLKRLVKIETLDLLPVGITLEKYMG